MKPLSFILALYVFCLSVGPIIAKALIIGAEEECATLCCLTEHEEECLPVAETEHSHRPNDCCDDGICNPFAGCTGCAGFTIPVIFGLVNTLDVLALQPVAVLTVNPRLPDHAIWHPPQFI